jgi:hypothetical protein
MTMKFIFDREASVWRCGEYVVWVQARPRDEGTLWGARCGPVDRPWLTDCADSRSEAIDVCREHAAKAKA